MKRALSLLFLLCLTGPAFSGAWPRPAGDSFIALKAGSDGALSVYAEHGATERLTLGLSADRFASRGGQAELFTRTALRPDGPTQIALELNARLALDEVPLDWQTAADGAFFGTALHLGRGFDTRLGPGWIDMRIAHLQPVGAQDALNQGRLTTGLSFTDRAKAFVEVEASRVADENRISVGTNIAFEFRDRSHLTFGVVVDPAGALPDRVDLGLWLAF